jgi:hypothetical protein
VEVVAHEAEGQASDAAEGELIADDEAESVFGDIVECHLSVHASAHHMVVAVLSQGGTEDPSPVHSRILFEGSGKSKQ